MRSQTEPRIHRPQRILLADCGGDYAEACRIREAICFCYESRTELRPSFARACPLRTFPPVEPRTGCLFRPVLISPPLSLSPAFLAPVVSASLFTSDAATELTLA